MVRRSIGRPAREKTKAQSRRQESDDSEGLSDEGLELDGPANDDQEEDEGISQWAPDDWDGEDDGDSDPSDEEGGDRSDESEEDEQDDAQDLTRLQKEMQSLPLATLMKAQRSLKTREPVSSEDETAEAGGGPSTLRAKRLAEAKAKLAEMQRRKGKAATIPSALPDLSDEEDGSEDEFAEMRRKKGGPDRRDEGTAKERVKRDNKHAPTAMSTKKQVSRNRQVIDVGAKSDRRDPRFDSLSSSTTDANLQSKSYSFLPQMLKDELSGLRTAVKMAQKAEAHCPWAEKPARTAERETLELQLGQLRTKIERGEREARERDVLAKFKKEENEKRGQGKGAWYLKKSDQKDLLLKARFENLEKKGGKTAVKKALEKKRKKVAGKEKKSRPFAKGFQGGSDGKRRRTA